MVATNSNTTLESLPKHSQINYQIGTTFYRLGDYGQAIELLSKAIELSPDFSSSYNNRGTAYSRIGDFGRAIQDYDKAISLNPDSAMPYFNRGYDHARLGNKSEAERDFIKAIELGYDRAAVEEAIIELEDMFIERRNVASALKAAIAEMDTHHRISE